MSQSHSRAQQIVDTIVELVESRGVGRVTTAALARRLGFTEAALYRYFSGKGAILAAAIQQVAEALFAAMQHELQPAAARTRAVVEAQLAEHIVHFTAHRGALLELLMSATISRESELQEAANAFLEEYFHRMTWYFESLTESDVIDRSLRPRDLASTWICQLLGGFVRTRLTLEGWEPTRQDGYRAFLARLGTASSATV
jgi:TetR/AcrR family transcriptional regulator